jgi:hypothetical protein
MADTPLTSDQAAQAVEQEARNIIRLVEYFDHLDATSPMMRFIIAGSVVGGIPAVAIDFPIDHPHSEETDGEFAG